MGTPREINLPNEWFVGRKIKAEIAGFRVHFSLVRMNEDGTVTVKIWEVERKSALL